VGGVDPKGVPKDTRTEAQRSALLQLIRELKRKYPNATIHGHRDFAAKACPSFDATKEYSEL
jgi:N-acetylmuramoyl-L-alanine amidase